MSSDRVYDWLAYHARYNPDSPACVDLGTGRRFTYAGFNERSTRVATGLAAEHGVGKGDRVAITPPTAPTSTNSCSPAGSWARCSCR